MLPSLTVIVVPDPVYALLGTTPLLSAVNVTLSFERETVIVSDPSSTRSTVSVSEKVPSLFVTEAVTEIEVLLDTELFLK